MGARSVSAPLVHAARHEPGGADPILGIVAADIDSALEFWDDPLGIGFAATHLPSQLYSSAASPVANRANFAKCISGGVTGRLYYGVSVSSGNHDIGIYTTTGTRDAALPDTRAFSTGSIPVPTVGSVSVVVSPTVTVKARQHWMALAVNNASASFYTFAQGNLVAALVGGWACYKDTSFPLPDPISSPVIGLYRHFSIVGRTS